MRELLKKLWRVHRIDEQIVTAKRLRSSDHSYHSDSWWRWAYKERHQADHSLWGSHADTRAELATILHDAVRAFTVRFKLNDKHRPIFDGSRMCNYCNGNPVGCDKCDLGSVAVCSRCFEDEHGCNCGAVPAELCDTREWGWVDVHDNVHASDEKVFDAVHVGMYEGRLTKAYDLGLEVDVPSFAAWLTQKLRCESIRGDLSVAVDDLPAAQRALNDWADTYLTITGDGCVLLDKKIPE